jgi:hypothetical protein
MDQVPQHIDRMRAEQVAALFQHVALGVTGAAAASVILAGGLIQIGVLELLPGALWVIYIAIAQRHISYCVISIIALDQKSRNGENGLRVLPP